MKSLKPFSIIFLLSLSTLSFEIILARIFSYVLAYHFVFIIIAFAILALALGQLYASRLAVKNSFSFSKYFIVLLLLFPISLAAVFILASVEGIGSGSVGLIIYILLAGVTFFLVGIITASIFQANGDKSRILYAFDMIGAAAGSLLGLLLLNTFSIIQALSIILFVFSIAALTAFKLETQIRKGYLIITLSAIFVSLLIIFITPDVEINIAKSSEKDLLRLKSNPSVKTTTVESRWNSFGRTDLVKFLYPDLPTGQAGNNREIEITSTIEIGDGKKIIIIIVRDTGKGIKEDVKIFEPFFTTKSSGTGLGLSVAQKIVEQHKGRIKLVSSEQGKTIFEITLPFKEVTITDGLSSSEKENNIG
jgi:hypothetical protein